MSNLQIIIIDNLTDAKKELKKIGVDKHAIGIMAPKSILLPIKLCSITCPAANILKQEMLSVGGDTALSRNTYFLKNKKTDVLLLGTLKQYHKLISKLNNQPLGLKDIGKNLAKAIKQYQKTPNPIKLSSKTFFFDKQSYILGILNVTPDSFSDGNKFLEPESAYEQAIKLIEEGADIIDIGGESTRPGSNSITASEEKKRIIPVIRKLAGKIKTPVSVDTYKSDVARAALDEGAEIVNDISGLRFDNKMAKLIARYNVPVIIMHIKGQPKNMQENPEYENLLLEIIEYLRYSIDIAKNAGVDEQKIIIDPGIGFGKTAGHNLEIIKNLNQLKILGRPILLGVSRKSFIGKTLNLPVEDRLEGTIASSIAGLIKGANFFRTHDVKQVKRAIRMAEAILNSNS